jgi:hypothetical protein
VLWDAVSGEPGEAALPGPASAVLEEAALTAVLLEDSEEMDLMVEVSAPKALTPDDLEE